MLPRTNARDLKQVRRVDGAARQDHLADSRHAAILAVLLERDADAAPAVKQQSGGKRPGLDPQILPALRLRQEGARGRAAQAAVARHLTIADAFMLAAVEIPGQRNADLL